MERITEDDLMEDVFIRNQSPHVLKISQSALPSISSPRTGMHPSGRMPDVDESSVDIYGDLSMDGVFESGVSETQHALVQDRVKVLEKENQNMKKLKEQVTKNISCLFLTAKSELEAKNKEIETKNREIERLTRMIVRLSAQCVNEKDTTRSKEKDSTTSNEKDTTRSNEKDSTRSDFNFNRKQPGQDKSRYVNEPGRDFFIGAGKKRGRNETEPFSYPEKRSTEEKLKFSRWSDGSSFGEKGNAFKQPRYNTNESRANLYGRDGSDVQSRLGSTEDKDRSRHDSADGRDISHANSRYGSYIEGGRSKVTSRLDPSERSGFSSNSKRDLMKGTDRSNANSRHYSVKEKDRSYVNSREDSVKERGISKSNSRQDSVKERGVSKLNYNHNSVKGPVKETCSSRSDFMPMPIEHRMNERDSEVDSKSGLIKDTSVKGTESLRTDSDFNTYSTKYNSVKERNISEANTNPIAKEEIVLLDTEVRCNPTKVDSLREKGESHIEKCNPMKQPATKRDVSHEAPLNGSLEQNFKEADGSQNEGRKPKRYTIPRLSKRPTVAVQESEKSHCDDPVSEKLLPDTSTKDSISDQGNCEKNNEQTQEKLRDKASAITYSVTAEVEKSLKDSGIFSEPASKAEGDTSGSKCIAENDLRRILSHRRKSSGKDQTTKGGGDVILEFTRLNAESMLQNCGLRDRDFTDFDIMEENTDMVEDVPEILKKEETTKKLEDCSSKSDKKPKCFTKARYSLDNRKKSESSQNSSENLKYPSSPSSTDNSQKPMCSQNAEKRKCSANNAGEGTTVRCVPEKDLYINRRKLESEHVIIFQNNANSSKKADSKEPSLDAPCVSNVSESEEWLTSDNNLTIYKYSEKGKRNKCKNGGLSKDSSSSKTDNSLDSKHQACLNPETDKEMETGLQSRDPKPLDMSVRKTIEMKVSAIRKSTESHVPAPLKDFSKLMLERSELQRKRYRDKLFSAQSSKTSVASKDKRVENGSVESRSMPSSNDFFPQCSESSEEEEDATSPSGKKHSFSSLKKDSRKTSLVKDKRKVVLGNLNANKQKSSVHTGHKRRVKLSSSNGETTGSFSPAFKAPFKKGSPISYPGDERRVVFASSDTDGQTSSLQATTASHDDANLSKNYPQNASVALLKQDCSGECNLDLSSESEHGLIISEDLSGTKTPIIQNCPNPKTPQVHTGDAVAALPDTAQSFHGKTGVQNKGAPDFIPISTEVSVPSFSQDLSNTASNASLPFSNLMTDAAENSSLHKMKKSSTQPLSPSNHTWPFKVQDSSSKSPDSQKSKTGPLFPSSSSSSSSSASSPSSDSLGGVKFHQNPSVVNERKTTSKSTIKESSRAFPISKLKSHDSDLPQDSIIPSFLTGSSSSIQKHNMFILNKNLASNKDSDEKSNNVQEFRGSSNGSSENNSLTGTDGHTRSPLTGQQDLVSRHIFQDNANLTPPKFCKRKASEESSSSGNRRKRRKNVMCTPHLIMLSNEEETSGSLTSPCKEPSELYPPGVRMDPPQISNSRRHIIGEPELLHPELEESRSGNSESTSNETVKEEIQGKELKKNDNFDKKGNFSHSIEKHSSAQNNGRPIERTLAWKNYEESRTRPLLFDREGSIFTAERKEREVRKLTADNEESRIVTPEKGNESRMPPQLRNSKGKESTIKSEGSQHSALELEKGSPSKIEPVGDKRKTVLLDAVQKAFETVFKKNYSNFKSEMATEENKGRQLLKKSLKQSVARHKQFHVKDGKALIAGRKGTDDQAPGTSKEKQSRDAPSQSLPRQETCDSNHKQGNLRSKRRGKAVGHDTGKSTKSKINLTKPMTSNSVNASQKNCSMDVSSHETMKSSITELQCLKCNLLLCICKSGSSNQETETSPFRDVLKDVPFSISGSESKDPTNCDNRSSSSRGKHIRGKRCQFVFGKFRKGSLSKKHKNDSNNSAKVIPDQTSQSSVMSSTLNSEDTIIGEIISSLDTSWQAAIERDFNETSPNIMPQFSVPSPALVQGSSDMDPSDRLSFAGKIPHNVNDTPAVTVSEEINSNELQETVNAYSSATSLSTDSMRRDNSRKVSHGISPEACAVTSSNVLRLKGQEHDKKQHHYSQSANLPSVDTEEPDSTSEPFPKKDCGLLAQPPIVASYGETIIRMEGSDDSNCAPDSPQKESNPRLIEETATTSKSNRMTDRKANSNSSIYRGSLVSLESRLFPDDEKREEMNDTLPTSQMLTESMETLAGNATPKFLGSDGDVTDENDREDSSLNTFTVCNSMSDGEKEDVADVTLTQEGCVSDKSHGSDSSYSDDSDNQSSNRPERSSSPSDFKECSSSPETTKRSLVPPMVMDELSLEASQSLSEFDMDVYRSRPTPRLRRISSRAASISSLISVGQDSPVSASSRRFSSTPLRFRSPREGLLSPSDYKASDSCDEEIIEAVELSTSFASIPELLEEELQSEGPSGINSHLQVVRLSRHLSFQELCEASIIKRKARSDIRLEAVNSCDDGCDTQKYQKARTEKDLTLSKHRMLKKDNKPANSSHPHEDSVAQSQRGNKSAGPLASCHSPSEPVRVLPENCQDKSSRDFTEVVKNCKQSIMTQRHESLVEEGNDSPISVTGHRFMSPSNMKSPLLSPSYYNSVESCDEGSNDWSTSLTLNPEGSEELESELSRHSLSRHVSYQDLCAWSLVKVKKRMDSPSTSTSRGVGSSGNDPSVVGCRRSPRLKTFQKERNRGDINKGRESKLCFVQSFSRGTFNKAGLPSPNKNSFGQRKEEHHSNQRKSVKIVEYFTTGEEIGVGSPTKIDGANFLLRRLMPESPRSSTKTIQRQQEARALSKQSVASSSRGEVGVAITDSRCERKNVAVLETRPSVTPDEDQEVQTWAEAHFREVDKVKLKLSERLSQEMVDDCHLGQSGNSSRKGVVLERRRRKEDGVEEYAGHSSKSPDSCLTNESDLEVEDGEVLDSNDYDDKNCPFEEDNDDDPMSDNEEDIKVYADFVSQNKERKPICDRNDSKKDNHENETKRACVRPRSPGGVRRIPSRTEQDTTEAAPRKRPMPCRQAKNFGRNELADTANRVSPLALASPSKRVARFGGQPMYNLSRKDNRRRRRLASREDDPLSEYSDNPRGTRARWGGERREGHGEPKSWRSDRGTRGRNFSGSNGNQRPIAKTKRDNDDAQCRDRNERRYSRTNRGGLSRGAEITNRVGPLSSSQSSKVRERYDSYDSDNRMTSNKRSEDGGRPRSCDKIAWKSQSRERCGSTDDRLSPRRPHSTERGGSADDRLSPWRPQSTGPSTSSPNIEYYDDTDDRQSRYQNRVHNGRDQRPRSLSLRSKDRGHSEGNDSDRIPSGRFQSHRHGGSTERSPSKTASSQKFAQKGDLRLTLSGNRNRMQASPERNRRNQSGYNRSRDNYNRDK